MPSTHDCIDASMIRHLDTRSRERASPRSGSLSRTPGGVGGAPSLRGHGRLDPRKTPHVFPTPTSIRGERRLPSATYPKSFRTREGYASCAKKRPTAGRPSGRRGRAAGAGCGLFLAAVAIKNNRTAARGRSSFLHIAALSLARESDRAGLDAKRRTTLIGITNAFCHET
ncbi:hypothetical protein EVAR_48_1 [Eumeta japonica]|uniref:Uncharacterized protein n=1 Tax=Eumeta variegata TaxID=151549 RepID=A0A4C1S7S6_EUMVA|nr:hypothetical protein EVAR_48_1 [Eumeta japonica]